MKILFIFGTRPEAIKMAPLVKAFSVENNIKTRVCVTGQHRDMLDQVLEVFQIQPDYDLSVMEADQSITNVICAVMQGMEPILASESPDYVVVHGDTASTLAGALSAFLAKVPIIHIEAGLRTGDLLSPWPEEGNRKVVTSLAELHFAPTEDAKENLIKEGVKNEKIWVTGNTVIDALKICIEHIENSETDELALINHFENLGVSVHNTIILVTSHRRENLGTPQRNIFGALLLIAHKYPNVDIVYPVHLNPNVKALAHQMLGGVDNIKLIPPQEYKNFVYLMRRCYLILTDSGGLQEEAPFLKKPVLLLRDTTERPEAVEAGTVQLVGHDKRLILEKVQKLFEDHDYYTKFVDSVNPYGDGTASNAIVKITRSYVGEK